MGPIMGIGGNRSYESDAFTLDGAKACSLYVSEPYRIVIASLYFFPRWNEERNAKGECKQYLGITRQLDATTSFLNAAAPAFAEAERSGRLTVLTKNGKPNPVMEFNPRPRSKIPAKARYPVNPAASSTRATPAYHWPMVVDFAKDDTMPCIA